jgi:hypothetical protein
MLLHCQNLFERKKTLCWLPKFYTFVTRGGGIVTFVTITITYCTDNNHFVLFAATITLLKFSTTNIGHLVSIEWSSVFTNTLLVSERVP